MWADVVDGPPAIRTLEPTTTSEPNLEYNNNNNNSNGPENAGSTGGFLAGLKNKAGRGLSALTTRKISGGTSSTDSKRGPTLSSGDSCGVGDLCARVCVCACVRVCVRVC